MLKNTFWLHSLGPNILQTYTSDVRASCANAMDIQTDTAGGLRDHCALLQRVINALDAVVFHSQQEATMDRKNRVKTSQTCDLGKPIRNIIIPSGAHFQSKTPETCATWESNLVRFAHWDFLVIITTCQKIRAHLES